MALVVQKYGGTSVGSLDHIRNVARHVASTVHSGGHKVIVAISAMGDQTDELLEMARSLHPRPPRRELDMLLTSGERMSAALLAIALDNLAVPSVSLTGSQCGILTDETHGNARISRILGDRIRMGIAEGRVVIVAGFQGMSPRTKEVTTLGRGGTDLSAIAIAAALQADRCQLYKDVPGVFTADPRVVPAARVLSRLSWDAMCTLAWSGANVLHARGAHVAAKYNIPFEIRSSLELERPGTLIAQDSAGSMTVETPKIEALAHKKEMTLLECRVQGPKAGAVIARALDWLWQHGESPMISSQVGDGQGSYLLTKVLKTALTDDFETMLRRTSELEGGQASRQRRQDGLATISVVGAGFQQSPETVQHVCEALPTPALLIDTRNTAINVVVAEDRLTDALKALHQKLLETSAPLR